MTKFLTLVVLSILPISAHAALDSSQVHPAETKKTNTYLRTGVIIGGTAEVKDVIIEDIRRAKNAGYERVVIDLQNPVDPTLAKGPYYQIALEPAMKRVVVSIFGRAKPAFNAQKVKTTFARSSVVSRLDLLPQVDPEIWVMSMQLQEAPSVEAFELSSPQRLILDFKTSPKQEATTAPKAAASKPARAVTAPKSAKPTSRKREASPSPVEPFSDFEGVPESVDN
jgi:hypothetical protein